MLFLGGPGDRGRRGGRSVDAPHLPGHHDRRRFPNLALAFGYTRNASWTLKCELSCDYVTRAHAHAGDGLRQCTRCTVRGTEVEPCRSSTSPRGYVQRSVQSFSAGTRISRGRCTRTTCVTRAMRLRVSRTTSSDRPTRHPSTPRPLRPGPPSPGADRDEALQRQGRRITGRGSGIGRALALELARRGCHLALSDIDEGVARRDRRAVRGSRRQGDVLSRRRGQPRCGVRLGRGRRARSTARSTSW